MAVTDHLEELEHYCFEDAQVNLHTDPEFYHCGACDLTWTTEQAAEDGLEGEGSLCPHCREPLNYRPVNRYGEVHAVLCTDKFRHYPEWLREGRITTQEYLDWVNTLTPAEKLGVYKRDEPQRILSRLNSGDVSIHDNGDMENFQKVVHEKIKARAIQHLKHEKPFRVKADSQKLDMAKLQKQPDKKPKK